MSLAQGNNTPTRPRIEPGSPDPESDALTTRPVRSPNNRLNLAGGFGVILTKVGVGVSCRNLYSFVVYLYVNGSGSISSVEEERANLSAVIYLLLCGFCLESFPLPLGAWDGLRYFIVALPEPSI